MKTAVSIAIPTKSNVMRRRVVPSSRSDLMNTFNVSLCISDFICVNNCKNLLEKQVIVTNSNDSICLKCDYLLNVIRVQDNFFTILLQNGFQTYIRNIYENGYQSDGRKVLR